MKKRFTEEQIIGIVMEAEAGLKPAELRRLKQLGEENAKLKRLVADLSLDKAMLQDVLSKNVWSAPALQGERCRADACQFA
ncbi:putative transposase [Burkholderia aenigmatica]|uniref:Putative transposase n=1 Tax=Burkholderia aenigmatica TaxID=2015348 RepID=A0A6P2R2J1_9BURK|nr:putative transposase [Burkholderia aenigmatica]